MGQEISANLEASKARVLLALQIMTGEGTPGMFEEEKGIILQYRELRSHGWGKMEVSVVDHHLETLNATRTLKRKDFVNCPKKYLTNP